MMTLIIGLAAIALGLLGFVAGDSNLGLLAAVGGLVMSVAAALAWRNHRPGESDEAGT